MEGLVGSEYVCWRTAASNLPIAMSDSDCGVVGSHGSIGSDSDVVCSQAASNGVLWLRWFGCNHRFVSMVSCANQSVSGSAMISAKRFEISEGKFW